MNYSNNIKTRRILSNDDIKSIAPCVFAEHAMEGVSDRYSFIPTSQVVDGMRNAGWLPVNVQAKRALADDRKGFQKHVIRFQQANSEMTKVGDSRFELVLTNSHDRSSGYQLHAGLFRLVCSNGLVVGAGTVGQVNLRHNGLDVDQVVAASFRIAERLPVMGERVGAFQARQMTDAERQAFAEKALALRYEAGEAPIKAQALLNPRRYDDRGTDLWRTFNTVQENLTQGKQHGYRPDDSRRGFRRVSTRAVTSISEDLRINKELWTLAESFSA